MRYALFFVFLVLTVDFDPNRVYTVYKDIHSIMTVLRRERDL